MEITIIPDRCIACGLCHLQAPKIFDYEDSGIVRFYGVKNSESHEISTRVFDQDFEALNLAIKSCPTAALVKS